MECPASCAVQEERHERNKNVNVLEGALLNVVFIAKFSDNCKYFNSKFRREEKK